MEFLTICVIILCVFNVVLFYQQWELKYFVYTAVLQALNEIKQMERKANAAKSSNITVNVNNNDNNTNTNGNDNTVAQNSTIEDSTIQ